MSLVQTHFRNHILGLGKHARAVTLEGEEEIWLNCGDPGVSFERADDRRNGTLTFYPAFDPVTIHRRANEHEVLRCEQLQPLPPRYDHWPFGAKRQDGVRLRLRPEQNYVRLAAGLLPLAREGTGLEAMADPAPPR